MDNAHSPAENMALDEALLQTAPDRSRPLLRFYQWDRPAVSIGYVQKYTAAPSDRFAVVRRPTGGGIVYHDHDLTYTVVLSSKHWLSGLDRTRSYDWVNRSVLTGIQACGMGATVAQEQIPHSVDRQTMVCFTNPTRYDLLAGNRKIAGSAQRRTRDGILHQGSCHFGGPLPVQREELQNAIIKGFEQVLQAVFSTFTAPRELLDLAHKLQSERYELDEWNKRR